MGEYNKIKGGLSDNKTLEDIARQHDEKGYYDVEDMVLSLKKQLQKGIKVEMEHTNDKNIAKEIVMNHLFEDPNYYDKLSKIEASESTTASSSGSYSAPMLGKMKRPISTIHNMTETTVADASGSYDVPFGDGSKTPLKINGEKSIKTSRAVKDKNFPKWGGPGGVYVRIKDKCKKYPYCNQGDIKSLEFYEDNQLIESVKEVSKQTGIPYSEIEKIVLNEISKIFIK